jgi:homoserine O-succinyltransferase
MQQPVRLAILDMNRDTPNLSLGRLKALIESFENEFSFEIFNVRGRCELPDMSFDVYISSGGPGSPHDGDGIWDLQFYRWMDEIWNWNQSGNPPKHVFFICHSFQMACKHFGIGKVNMRYSPSFGIFPVHKTAAAYGDPLLDGLPDPFYVADFRDWQVVEPDLERLESLGAKILVMEKERPHIPLDRAIMTVRFSPEIFGTQFHPEADAEGMLHHFTDPERRQKIIANHSEEKYLNMIEHLNDPDKINLTNQLILPLFLQRSLRAIREAYPPEPIPMM